MLNAKSGWANVKSHVRAMAFFMNRARASGMNMDFDDALNRLTTTAAYAYDKAVEEDQKAAAVAAAQKMYMANVPPPPPKKFDTAAIAKALASVPQPKAAVIQHVSTAPVQPESHTGLFLVGALVLVAAAGGGYYLYSSKKKAS